MRPTTGKTGLARGESALRGSEPALSSRFERGTDEDHRKELAWHGIETNEFGTDEFLKWCEIVGTEPYLCFNMGTGTLEEALGWVEYCNCDDDSYYADMRRQNGREKPYKVKYWALGNECWGPWQVEQLTQEDYAKKAYQWAKALKLLDPSIKLVLCGKEGPTHWDYHVTKECINYTMHVLGNNDASSLIDMHSIHIYTASNDHLKNVTAPRQAERAIEVTASLIDLARIENKVPPKVPKQKICFDEWNVWDPVRAPGWLGAEEKYTLSDALAVANWLNVLVRQSKHIGMATIAQSVNVIAPLMTTKTGLMKQSTWWPLLLFSKYMRGSTVACHVQSGEYEGPTHPEWIRGSIETPWIETSAAVSDEGIASLSVVNIHESKSFVTKVEGIPVGAKVVVYTVMGDNVQSTNNEEKTEVIIEESSWTSQETYKFPNASMTMLRWRL